ncbi:MAG: hypothetical protein QNI86_01220 [Halieaceae bacterium]|nr:hypothetical protein [Halieaceae bacterium]
MDSSTSKSTLSYSKPWTLRIFDALPGNPAQIGVAFTLTLLTIFFLGRVLADGASTSTPGDLRIAITQILMVTYSASAYAYLLIVARETTQGLSPIAQHLPDWQIIADRAGRHRVWIPVLIGAVSYLIIGVGVTNVTTPDLAGPWQWQTWNYDVFWHRGTTAFFSYWTGCLSSVMLIESIRLSRLTDDISSMDLLDLRPYQPLIRQGLTNALLLIGMVSVLSLLGVESRYWPALIGFWITFMILAWIGLMLPLRGIRRKIRLAKQQELAWCEQRLGEARDALKSGASDQRPISEILAYQKLVESIRNWPFDNSTLARFTLYLLIPLGSWFGGAMVERGLDFILS